MNARAKAKMGPIKWRDLDATKLGEYSVTKTWRIPTIRTCGMTLCAKDKPQIDEQVLPVKTVERIP